ncbi:retron Ec78 anti-phage system effector HNH endonuclease PtuB [Pseudomonas nunensis]|uniref:retron Ec78 anti-phage system effector HNH endonuclease PtuB n=1 Tax=Pseudomonas nunensis TaxID=2961896 RepID=UPI0025AFF0D4|nr:retron Ec78 anti-phage system effector HNH endonuclease PtuB [Pseudomonas nunensis]MDN3222535.1 TIGR02646 family protein [Pseudomonas nunensis]
MRKLVRGEGPRCLTRYKNGVDRWSLDSPTREERGQIWEYLQAVHDTRCAYCEADISNGNAHLEHFRQRDRFPPGTFAWSNLFGSCNREASCGKFKDSCGAYDHAVLIKPDDEDPDDYFVFVSDGTISVRADIDNASRHRATETLRIFNLNAENGALRQIRREAVRPHLDTAQALMEILLENPEIEGLQAFIDEEIQKTACLPFATAIRHSLSARP